MFKVNPDGMRMEPTPERVLSVCRLVSHKSMSRDEVRQCMTLGINDEKEIDAKEAVKHVKPFVKED